MENLNEKKQIEEMAKHCPCYFGGECCFGDELPEKCDRFCQYGTYAEILYNAGYRKQEWISVEDRLPDEDGEYLTWDGLVCFLIWFNASLGLWNVSEGGDTSSAIRGVTHWMPLPEAPKMEGGE
jgi:hypothetical protein